MAAKQNDKGWEFFLIVNIGSGKAWVNRYVYINISWTSTENDTALNGRKKTQSIVNVKLEL